MNPNTTMVTLRSTVTTIISDTSLTTSTFSSTRDRSAIIADNLFRKNDRLPAKEANSLWRSFLAFLFVSCNITLNHIVLAIIHERVPRNQPPLPDISFDILPSADWALNVAEYLMIVQVIAVFLLILLHKHRVIIFRRLCLILGLLYLFRAICMASTQLPIPNKNYYCSPQLNNSTDPSSNPILTNGEYLQIIALRVFHLSFTMGLSITGQYSYCGDYIYSGHTIILTLAYLMLREYVIPSRCRTYFWKFFHFLNIGLSLVGVISILLARGHYLIDIIIAYYATTRIFWIYHELCYSNVSKFKCSKNYISRVWWFQILKYFESDSALRYASGEKNNNKAAQLVPRYFEWPFLWPRFLRRKRCSQRLQQSKSKS